MNLMEMYIAAVRNYCTTSCARPDCAGCPFERHSERLRQVGLFLARRERIAAARRTAAAG